MLQDRDPFEGRLCLLVILEDGFVALNRTCREGYSCVKEAPPTPRQRHFYKLYCTKDDPIPVEPEDNKYEEN